MFSIVVPTYNRSRLLCRCLDSIKMQTFRDYEVLILDDCSTDDTPEVVKEYLQDERFKYVRFDKNHGHGDRIMKIAQDSGLFVGEWVAFLADDEYWYNEKHLEYINDAVGSDSCIDMVAVDMIFDFDGIVVGRIDDSICTLPSVFKYESLSLGQRKILAEKRKVVFEKQFLIKSDFLSSDKQGGSDVVYEGDSAYALLYPYARICHVSKIYHVFGMSTTARRKYLDFYNFIVSMGMVAMHYPECFYQKLINYYSEVSATINAFFDWGSTELAGVLNYFFNVLNKDDYARALRDIAQVYKKYHQDNFLVEYEKFNAMLLSKEERDNAIDISKNIVLYGDGSYRREIENYLRKKDKNIMFIVDDNKDEFCKLEEITKNKCIDLVFITSASPRVVKVMMDKLTNIEENFKIVSLLTRDATWNKGLYSW